MAVSIEEGLGALDRIIARAEERRVEQMIQIAVLLAEERDASGTQEELRRTERLLKIMRTQRTLLISAQSGRCSEDLNLDLALTSAARSSPAAPGFVHS